LTSKLPSIIKCTFTYKIVKHTQLLLMHMQVPMWHIAGKVVALKSLPFYAQLYMIYMLFLLNMLVHLDFTVICNLLFFLFMF
jgi:hypothetical protein